MKFNSFNCVALGGLLVAILVFVLVIMIGLSPPRSQVVYPRKSAEALINLGRLPDKGMMITFDFPPISEAEVSLLRKNINASIFPEGSGWVTSYEPGDIYPDGRGYTYAMFEVSTKAVQPHFVKLQFLNADKWPEKLIVTVNSIGL